MKLIIYIPDDAETLHLITKTGKQIKSDVVINISEKVCKCQICRVKFLSPAKNRKYCSDRCKNEATRMRKEQTCDHDTMTQIER